MGDFTAKEIQRQAERVVTQINRLRSSVNSTTGDLDKIASIIDSEDSNLASTLRKDSKTLEALEEAIYSKFYTLSDKMQTYVMKTIQNEQTLSQETESIDSIVQSVSDTVSSLNVEEI